MKFRVVITDKAPKTGKLKTRTKLVEALSIQQAATQFEKKNWFLTFTGIRSDGGQQWLTNNRLIVVYQLPESLDEYMGLRPESLRQQHLELIQRLAADYKNLIKPLGVSSTDYVFECLQTFEAELYEEISLL